MKEFKFDLYLFAALRVQAETEEKARAKLDFLLDCADVKLTHTGTGEELEGEASLATTDQCVEPKLYAIDGEEIES